MKESQTGLKRLWSVNDERILILGWTIFFFKNTHSLAVKCT